MPNNRQSIMPRVSAPKLPQLLDRKIYKTGQTRGADDDEIFQNRVSRASTVLIPYLSWERCRIPSATEASYESGFIVLISPDEYFGTPGIDATLAEQGLALGTNTLVFYERRQDWNQHDPDAQGWLPAISRSAPLGGMYAARVPATTARANGTKINRGFTQTARKGAGIRVYEYASPTTIDRSRLQLEALFWKCRQSDLVAIANGMTPEEATARKADNLAKCARAGLIDMQRLTRARMLNPAGHTICPLCLEELCGQGFFNRMEQAEGRFVHDLTITQLNLFHVEELRTGVLNHRPYNLGWGHHHCNVVVKDSGIIETLGWMREVVDRNVAGGYLAAPPPVSNSGN